MQTKSTTIRHDGTQENTLGSLRLRHHETNEIILIPTPSRDPNDPLNWSRAFRYYIVIVWKQPWTSLGPKGPDFSSHISKVAFFYSTTALCQGIGMFFWMPLIVKYGRRPVYIFSFILYFATSLWSGFARTYGVELAGRIVMGLAAGAGECLGPLTIADIFFLHERGAVMATYTAALSMGAAGGIVVDGLIMISHDWRYIYYVGSALLGAVTILVIFTFPETTFNRHIEEAEVAVPSDDRLDKTDRLESNLSEYHETIVNSAPRAKRTYIQSLQLFPGTFTSESLSRVFIRPIVLIMLPPVLWASLVFAVTIGFLIAITSNFATAFSTAYSFSSWKSGLCFSSGIIGSFLGIAFGGHISDWSADWFTQRNGGIREPEMRLPSIVIGGTLAPIALILYGVGIDNQLHWMVPTLGLGLLNFAIVQATNVAMVYVIDCYRPAVGEVTVSILAFKAAFGFLLSFYTNPWTDMEGYSKAFGEMACISGIIMLMGFVFYFWGKGIRQKTWEWRLMRKYGHWDTDREVGE